MTTTEELLFWLSVGFYVVGFVFYLTALVFQKEKYFPWAHRLTVVGVIFNTLTMVNRYVVTGHLPVKDTYELNLVGAWSAALLFIFFCRRYRAVKLSGIVVLPFAFLMLGYGYFTGPEIGPLGPDYKSSWLVVHVLFAFLSYGCFAISAGLAVVLLIRSRYEKEDLPGFYTRFPGTEVLDDISAKLIAFGFVANTLMLISGSMWAHDLWGAYWAWDPIETWSLIGWLIYGIFLHLRFTMGWKGSKLAWLNLVSFVVIILSFWGVPYLTPSYHNLENLTRPLPD